jgi:hypothetical protein
MKGKYTALVTHIIPALDPNSQKQAQNQLDIIAKKVNFNLAPTVVIGEFNQVHWSKDLKGFKQKSKLSNCRKESSLTNLSISRMMSFHNEGLKCLSLRDIKNKDGENYGIQASYNLIEANPALGISNPRPFK